MHHLVDQNIYFYHFHQRQVEDSVHMVKISSSLLNQIKFTENLA